MQLDVFVRDTQANTLVRASVLDPGGTEDPGVGTRSAVMRDCRFLEVSVSVHA